GPQLQGRKFSRALVNAGIAPEFVKIERNLKDEHLLVELQAESCEVMPLARSHLELLRLLPSLLWRLEFVALMQELPPQCGGLLSQATPAALGEALTHSQVHSLAFGGEGKARFCLERLELLGDAVLKLLATMYAGYMLPQAAEGQLSQAATGCETNKWLRKVSKETVGFHSYLLMQPFRPTERLARLRKHRGPQKVVADAVEAALGAAFRSAGEAPGGAGAGAGAAGPLDRGAAAAWSIFAVALGKAPPPLAVSLGQAVPEVSDFKEAAAAALSASSSAASPELEAAAEVLKAYGYAFRQPQLLGALRARADGSRSRRFERWEFLGDAVLQVLIAHHVAREYPDFDEGELSETQQAYVCNRYISRRLVRRFGQAGLAAVFFPAASKALRRYAAEVAQSQEETDFIVGDKGADLAAAATSVCFKRILDFIQNQVPHTFPSHFKCVADAYEARPGHSMDGRPDAPGVPSIVPQEALGRRRSLREKRRCGERRSMATVARRLKDVMEERGSLTMVPEEDRPPSPEDSDLASALLCRARSMSITAVSSLAAVAAWATTPHDAASTASGRSLQESQCSESESSDEAQESASVSSFSSASDSAIGLLGEALVRAQQETILQIDRACFPMRTLVPLRWALRESRACQPGGFLFQRLPCTDVMTWDSHHLEPGGGWGEVEGFPVTFGFSPNQTRAVRLQIGVKSGR
ncbi:unnamed protein product, partial [Effrenium voratum]